MKLFKKTETKKTIRKIVKKLIKILILQEKKHISFKKPYLLSFQQYYLDIIIIGVVLARIS